MTRSLIVISHWSAHGLTPLLALVRQLASTPPGAPYDLCVVSNCESGLGQQAFLDAALASVLADLPWQPEHLSVLVRENKGMNIGAWDAGWREHCHHTHFLFLQDEVELIATDWLLTYHRTADNLKIAGQSIYLLGESWNSKWDRPWLMLRHSPLDSYMQGHPPGQTRVAYYLECLNRWCVKLPASAGHLRSLVWYSNLQTLELIDGFRNGRSYGECIAAEMAASFSVLQHGGVVRQVSGAPFKVFWHTEWRKDGVSKR